MAMRRFIATVTAFALLGVLQTISHHGQADAAERTVGVIMTGNIPYYQDAHKAFVETINKEGLFQQGKVDVVTQSPAPEVMAWTNAARKFVSLDVDVIVSYGTPATLAVMKETSSIPIVFAGVYDPDEAGIRGKNITGINSSVPVATLIKNLKDITNFTKIGIVFNPDEKDTVLQAKDFSSLEGKYGFKVVLMNAEKKGEAEKLKSVDALALTTSCAAMSCVENFLGYAKTRKIPTASLMGGAEERGVIVTLSADPTEQGAEAARKVIELLKGASPSAMPVVKPSRVNLVINLKEATAMGLQIPFGILTSATRVIK
ncbi:MAG: ABC transporter substrate-binding protein [Thermodesulfovibrionales bacterium]